MIQEMDLMEIFYWFHRHPELSYEEYDTTAQIKKLLKAADVKICLLYTSDAADEL